MTDWSASRRFKELYAQSESKLGMICEHRSCTEEPVGAVMCQYVGKYCLRRGVYLCARHTPADELMFRCRKCWDEYFRDL